MFIRSLLPFVVSDLLKSNVNKLRQPQFRGCVTDDGDYPVGQVFALEIVLDRPVSHIVTHFFAESGLRIYNGSVLTDRTWGCLGTRRLLGDERRP